MNSAAHSASWFADRRYGLFIHWGPYSVLGRGEWAMNRERIERDQYEKVAIAKWGAENFDPREWCRLAREAGMGYAVLTTRHHDGFCLWDTQTTPWNAARLGPKRDLVRAYVDACREFDLKVGLYYSVADWTHAEYPDAFARDWPLGWPDEAARGRFVEYYRSQLEELMTGYGKIDVLWYDGAIPGPLDGEATNRRIKELQPEILINNRLGEPCDFHCSEQAIKAAETGLWEATFTLNDNWGYHAGDDNWKTPRQVAKMMVECAQGAGNFLLNIGPRGDGSVPEESVRILREVGDWLRRNKALEPEGFWANSDRSPFSWNCWGRVTTKGSTVYLHLWNSTGTELPLCEIGNRVLNARVASSGEELAFRQDADGRLFVTLPTERDPIITVLALEVEGEPRAITRQTTFWIPG